MTGRSTSSREPTYSDEDYSVFKRSVRDTESRLQLRRIEGRLAQKALVERLGKPVCDEMWTRFLKETS